MTTDSEFDIQRVRRLSPSSIGTIMALVALIAPLQITIIDNDWDTTIMLVAMMWQANFHTSGSDIFTNPLTLLESIPFTIFRIFFVYMMVRLYRGKTTKKRTLLIGIVSALQLVAIFYSAMLFTTLLFPRPFTYSLFMIPIPILLIVGFLIIRLFPPEENKMWIEEVEPRSWWGSQQEEGTKESKPKEKKSKPPDEIESPW